MNSHGPPVEPDEREIAPERGTAGAGLLLFAIVLIGILVLMHFARTHS